jgi:hypothetical protein
VQIYKTKVSKNNQDLPLDELRESIYLKNDVLGSRSWRMTFKMQPGSLNISLHGVRQVDVRTRTDVFLAGFSGPAKRRYVLANHRCTVYLRFTFTVKKCKGGLKFVLKT